MSYTPDATFDPSLVFDLEEGEGAVFLGQRGPLARVYTLSSVFEAHVLVAALEAEGIAAMVETHRELALGGLFIPQRGWGSIVTPVDDAERAVAIIEETLATLGVSDGDAQ